MSTLSVESLEAYIDAALAARSEEEMFGELIPVMSVLGSPELMGRSFLRGIGKESRPDYSGIQAAFERLYSHATNRQGYQSAERVRSIVLEVFGRHLLPSDSNSSVGDDVPEINRRSSAAAETSAASTGAALGAATNSGDSATGGAIVGDVATSVMTTPISCCEASGGTEEGDANRSESTVKGAGHGVSSTTTGTVTCVSARVGKTDSAALTWAPALVAAVLPLMADALPRDANGICVIPHRHRLDLHEVSEDSLYLTSSGRLAFRTNKVCDNCQTQIVDRFFYHCSENCDIDFCQECHSKLEEIFQAFFGHADAHGKEDHDSRYQRLMWVIQVTEHVAFHVLKLSAADRNKLAHEFAFEWPTSMFERFVRVVIDVVNAKVVHVQDVKDIQSDEKFWYAIGLLQFLYSANSLPCKIQRVDEQGLRWPKLEYDNFILEGINKCEPISEWQRWREHPSATVPDVLDIDEFRLTADFCSFLTHNNLVPVGFRRVCLLWDIWEQIQPEVGRVIPLEIVVKREPALLLQGVLSAFEGLSESQLRRPLRVTFETEQGAGPGVTKEFFQVALRSLLNGSGIPGLFRYNEQHRTYWFDETADKREAFRACGILLGQAVLNNVLVPNIFPRVLYDLLLHDLGSPFSRRIGLESLAMVDSELTKSLQRIFEYGDDDIHEVFGDIGWPTTDQLPEGTRLTPSNKGDFLQAYVTWFFHDRISTQFGPLSEGFRAILGGSPLLRSMVDSVQLEKIVCGASVPIDIVAIRRGATLEGWTSVEQEFYLASFWDFVENFTESEKAQFVVFVTASDRVPLRGWKDLQLTVLKNGVGDDRLPTAHTCFCQLLLPKYSSPEKLRTQLLLAMANSEGFGLR
eukprot:TRINITY_DN16295_c0_g2_i1.p1 TRINITY_DN16295_c0_g2~~TRINITY_DN16295_c0_g2_i1.p1  ORF type:complete len:861 (-),score=128.65 TRINITY_DN16295_c0_g2_i1:454-3036(-)